MVAVRTNFDTIVEAELVEKMEQYKSQNLHLRVYQRFDTSCITQIKLHLITKDDLIKLSEMFRDLAGQVQ